MNLVSIENLGKTQGDKTLFEQVTFGINSGEKLALIGVNGCGKSSLLRILTGEDEEYDGKVARNRELRVSYLHQVPIFNPEHTILEYVLQDDSPQIRLIREYERCMVEAKSNEVAQHRLAELMEEMDKSGAWQYENEFSALLSELTIEDTSLKMGELSGGMLKKVELARALVREANFLLLDEPTNHLDIETITWLQQYLIRTKKAVLLVTHDRYFLDQVCTGIFEIENQKLYRYNGNYSYYMEKKAQREAQEEREQSKIRNVLRRELAWLQRGVKARATRQKARQDNIEALQARQKGPEENCAEFSVGHRRLGKSILEVENISKRYDGCHIIQSFSRILKRGERIGLVGPNGSGKSTLIRLLTEAEPPDTGKVMVGVNTFFGVFDQMGFSLDPNKRVLEYLKEEAEHVKRADGKVFSVGQLLEQFLFPKRMFNELIGKLSGGERRRLYLIRVLLSNPNFLIFDEPTNDLDIQTLSLLEEFLLEFPGCVIVVSHDRYFLDRVVDHLLVFDGKGSIKEFPGNFSHYLAHSEKEKKQSMPQKTESRSKAAKDEAKSELSKKLSYTEKKELAKLPDIIEKLEQEKSELEAIFQGGETDYRKIEEANQKHQELEAEILAKMERWEELSEKEG